ncbi:unnamed protein product [Clonostachys rosea f. rosea IK726]|uniref:Uncharacterized protein n=1 Tax=Clonostachys rosea f. rosea IK726 TaxID=1349383 RepID=A0ACA9U8K1_BIOOC|nr:unnamed protein product [Clonostachys rosea f. rosea IK726]
MSHWSSPTPAARFQRRQRRFRDPGPPHNPRFSARDGLSKRGKPRSHQGPCPQLRRTIPHSTQKVVNKKTGQGNWQFTTVNPGRAQLVARDARHPERRLIIPVLNSVKWRLSNIIDDPREENSVQASGFAAF